MEVDAFENEGEGRERNEPSGSKAVFCEFGEASMAITTSNSIRGLKGRMTTKKQGTERLAWIVLCSSNERKNEPNMSMSR